MQDHEIKVPDIEGGVLEIHCAAPEGASDTSKVYIGDLELNTTVGLGIRAEDSFNKQELHVFIHHSSGGFTVLVPESRGQLEVFDINGRILESRQMQRSREIIELGTLPGQILIFRFTGQA